MAKRATTTEPNLPWLDSREDRTFRWLSGVMLLLFIVAGLILNSIQLPEIEKKNLVDVSPRLAKLILEKQKVKPEPKPEAPLPEKEKQPEKKKAEPKPEKKKEKKKEVKKESAREVAEKSGLIGGRHGQLDDSTRIRARLLDDGHPFEPILPLGTEASDNQESIDPRIVHRRKIDTSSFSFVHGSWHCDSVAPCSQFDPVCDERRLLVAGALAPWPKRLIMARNQLVLRETACG